MTYVKFHFQMMKTLLLQGRCIFATGSPFDPVTVNGQTFVPGQGNNAYIFPGVAFGAILSAMYHIDDMVFLRASQVSFTFNLVVSLSVSLLLLI